MPIAAVTPSPNLTDGNGHTTNFSYDDEDRGIAKTFADGSERTYNYENMTSRLRSVTDALNQVTTYTYNIDDTVQKVAYLNAVNPTPGVSFTYDPDYLRVLTITDGTGTTIHSYNPVLTPPALGMNQLASITGPQGDVNSLTYDALERITTRTLDSSVETFSFDSIGRLITDKNVLHTFNIAYMGGSTLPVSINLKARIIWREALTDALSLTRERVRVWVSANST